MSAHPLAALHRGAKEQELELPSEPAVVE